MNNYQNNYNNNNQMNNTQNCFNNSNNQIQSQMMMNNNNMSQNFNVNNINQINQNYLDENTEISTIKQANEMLKTLIKENNYLKKQLFLLSQNFENYKQTMNLNCYYNQFDINAYQLDNIYNSLGSKDIIQTKEEFGLINRGIRHFFNKNIVGCQGKFKSINDEFDPLQFKAILNQLEFFVLLVSLKEKAYNRRFGIFCNKSYNNMNSLMVMNNLNNQMNKMNLGIGMGMGMINNKNNIYEKNNNDSENETIFDSSLYLMSCFLFTFEDLKIYYKENKINVDPNFILKYNKKYQCILGSEGMKQMKM
jgi:hypothetical protein